MTEKMTERATLKQWLDREGIAYDMDMDGTPMFGGAGGYLNATLRVRTEKALAVFQFREDGSLADILTQSRTLPPKRVES